MTGRRFLPWIIGLTLTVAACLIYAATPSDQSTIRAMVRSGQIGEPVSSRLLEATLVSGEFADAIVVDEEEISGNWLILTVSASAEGTEQYSGIGLASVTFNDTTFLSSDQVGEGLLEAELRIGVPTLGVIAFELPASAQPHEASLRLVMQGWTPELDDVTELRFDASTLPRVDVHEIEDPRWDDE